jgi:predicted hotdog family 3-hydroxylacyl-ACP dehydratase
VDVTSIPVEALVPHRSGMLLIDRVLSDDGDTTRAHATVREDGLFVREGFLPSYVGIELMAQTIAVWGGLRQREKNEPMRLGFLLGTRRFESTVDGFPTGAELEVEAHFEIVSELGLAVFSCRIFHQAVACVTASINVFQPPDIGRYLGELIND